MSPRPRRGRPTRRGLRLAVFQLRPLPPPGHVLDGTNAVLLKVLRHFAGLGVHVTVHHPAALGTSEPFELLPGVDVVPVPPLLTGTVSGSLVADPMSHAAAVERIRETLGRSDRFYVHGANLPYFALDRRCPTVHSVHDLCATESVTGVLNFVGDRLVAVSDYIASCLREVLGRVRPIPDTSLHVVRNGFSADEFAPRDPAPLRRRLGLPDDALCVLYPHRPDPDKGILQAVRVLDLLRPLLPADVHRRVRLLVPTWERPRFAEDIPTLPPLPAEVLSCAAELDVADRIKVHPWIPVANMPRYYSIGVATLCIGYYPEAFGNVHIESLMAGTPAIVARAGAHRTSIPDDLVRKVDPGQVEHAAEHLADVIMRAERASPRTRRLLAERYPLGGMLLGYEEAILDCERQAPVAFPSVPAGPTPVQPDEVLRVPPWAAVLASGYYHDYSGYCTDEKLLECLSEISSGSPIGCLLERPHVGSDDVRRWLDTGLVTTG